MTESLPDEHPVDRSPPPAGGLYLLAFGSGFFVMVIEIAGARLMAPVFGLSAVPWTAVIGVVLGALAVGNHLGGRLADAGKVSLPPVLAFAGATALLPLLLSWLPAFANELVGFIFGALLSAAGLFALPVLALGMVVPYLIRAATTSVSEVGRRAGSVSAMATVGSILGTFSTGFLLLPAMPLPVLLSATAGALLLLAALARVLLRDGPPVPALVAAALLAGAVGVGAGEADPTVLHREQTVHGSIEVTEREWEGGTVREMWQNAGSSSAEYVATGEPAHDYALASLELLVPWLRGPAPADSALMLGGAALTLPVALSRRVPELAVDVVELDPAATRLAREYFVFGEEEDALDVRVLHGDARRFLRARSDDATGYGLIYLDVFDNLVSVPWTVVTVEALSLMREHLAPGGVVMANVLSPRAGPQAAFLRRLLATFEAAFPAVRAWPVVEADPGATVNVLVVAAENRAALDALPDAGLERVAVEAEGPPFTDAYAPVEYLQARVFWEGLRWY